VQDGDTLFDIALQFGVTVDEIVALNNLSDPTAIKVGQLLLIPGEEPAGLNTPTPTPLANPAGTGYALPIAGSCLPSNDNLMPNAPREYRAGIHEGVDFYSGVNCTTIPNGMPALAVKAGTVIRADHSFVEMTLDDLNDLLERSQAQGFTDSEALDRFRGRQVWVDHGGGTVTRYCHLSAIPAEITVGAQVQTGATVGLVGESGTPEAVTNPGTEIHLHFELRIGDSFLGAGLSVEAVRAIYEQAFSLP